VSGYAIILSAHGGIMSAHGGAVKSQAMTAEEPARALYFRSFPRKRESRSNLQDRRGRLGPPLSAFALCASADKNPPKLATRA